MCPGAIEMLTSQHRAGVAEDMGTVHCRAASYLIKGVCTIELHVSTQVYK